MSLLRLVSAFLIATYLTSFTVSANQDLVSLSGVQGGIAVVVDDVTILNELQTDEKFLVQGLFQSSSDLANAQSMLDTAGVYGRKTARSWDGSSLPFSKNTVNLLILPTGANIPFAEIDRVLVPYGVLMSEDEVSGSSSTLTDGWYKAVMPWPANVDQWTHWMHGPDNNAVSVDDYDEVPNSLQWIQGPRWLKSHQLAPPFATMVSSNGRLFSILDETLPTFGSLPDRWTIVARDAFNGTLLWKKPIAEFGEKYYAIGGKVTNDNWSNNGHPRMKAPLNYLRRMVSVGDYVYVTLGEYAPVSMLDGATGEVIKTFEGTEKTFEILCADGRLYLAKNNDLDVETDNPNISIMAVDIDSGNILWETDSQQGMTITGFTLPQYVDVNLTLGDEGVFFISKNAEIIALNKNTGAQIWSNMTGYSGGYPVITYYDSKIFFGQKGPTLITAYDAATGNQIWTESGSTRAYKSSPDVLVTQGMIWLRTGDGWYSRGLDPDTGEVLRQVDLTVVKDANTHANCYRSKATKNWFLLGENKGVEFLNANDDSKTNKVLWLKGQCRYGVLPTNGFVYGPPHFCNCKNERKLAGMTALGHVDANNPPDPSTAADVTQGPAFNSSFSLDGTSGDWPVYLKNNLRLSYQSSMTSEYLKPKWTLSVGDDLTAPIAAAGKVFVACKTSHTVFCIDENTGNIDWEFKSEGKVNSAPTFYEGRLIFGSTLGIIYCLDAANGDLAWKFRAAPMDLQMGAWEQIESVWPAFGSLPVMDGYVYCSAGRSANVNHGIYFYKLDVNTGNPTLSRRVAAITNDVVGKINPNTDEAITFQRSSGGVKADIMRADSSKLLFNSKIYNTSDLNGSDSKPHATFARNGFLDESLFNSASRGYRKTNGTFVSYGGGTQWSVTSVQMGNMKSASHHVFLPGLNNSVLKRVGTDGWSVNLPIIPRAFMVGESCAYVAGEEDIVDDSDPWAHYTGKKRTTLRVHSKLDGRALQKIILNAPPVHDSLAAANNKLFITCQDGSLICFEPLDAEGPLNFDEYISFFPGLINAESGADADPDKDGVASILEQWLAMDPSVQDTQYLPSIKMIGNVPHYQFSYDDSVTESTLVLEASTDLKTWTPEAIQPAWVSGSGIVKNVEIPVDTSSETRTFYRLTVGQ